MQQSRQGYYRAYFKGRLALNKKAYATAKVLSFNFRFDLLTTQNSSMLLEATPNAVTIGDVVIIIDAYGSVLHKGVIKSIGENQIDFNDILTLFDDDDFYKVGTYSNVNCNTRTRYLINHYKENNSDDPKITNLVNQFEITEGSTYPRGWKYEYTETHIINLYDKLLKQFDDYGIKIDVDIPINEGQCTIHTYQVECEINKLIDNTVVLPSMTPTIEIQETNKLIIYNQDGTSKRASFYLTKDGITDKPDELTRLNVVKTKIVNSDDDLNSIVSANLEKEMYNHKISIELVLNNKIYDYWSFVLGGKFEVSINRKYYNTIWTGFELNLEVDGVLEIVKMIFGKVRTKASERYFQ